MHIDELPLAQAYIPAQGFDGTFPPEEGLRKGTIFPSLYKPYLQGPNMHHDKEHMAAANHGGAIV